MGVGWTITVCTADEATARSAIAAAFAEVTRLEGVLSDYDPTSELSRLSARAPMAEAEAEAVSDDLWDVLVRAAAIRDATDGAFDVSVGPLTTLWRHARRTGRLPTPESLAAARAAVGPEAVELRRDDRTVRLPVSGTRLDAGGIGMGYAADRALEVLRRHGIESAMIDASGDVVVSGPPPGTGGWRIAIDPFRRGTGGRTLVLAHAAVTTSGDAGQAVVIDGRRYSHVVDPRTGLGVAGPAAATVIARDGSTADALATAASVLGPEAGPAVIERFAGGTAACFTWQDAQGRRHESATAGWPDH